MVKELKYLLYLFVIFLFLFLTLKYYFSDINKKNSYRLYNSVNEKILNYSSNLPFLEKDTDSIIQYIKKNIDKNKKDYNFWKLIRRDE